jgi:hypothetical protein
MAGRSDKFVLSFFHFNKRIVPGNFFSMAMICKLHKRLELEFIFVVTAKVSLVYMFSIV